MPDRDLLTAKGPTRIAALLRDAKPLLLDFSGKTPLDPGPWATRLTTLTAQTEGDWLLPVIGAVPAPKSVFIRPDGHVAWVGQGDDAGLAEALARWLGPA